MKQKDVLSLLVVLLFISAVISIVPKLANAATSSSSASVTNSVPTASSAQLNGGSAITVTTNASTEVIGAVTITDNNGCEDIVNVTGILFRSNITNGATATNNNRTHYNTTCTLNNDCTAGGSDITGTYNCTFNMEWYADATDAGSAFASTNWTFNVSPSDGTTGNTTAVVEELNTLTSLSLETSSIAFGSLALGADTGATNQNTSIANHGNEGLDVSLTGFASTSGDNLSMTCTVGTTAINKLEYNSTTFTFGSGSIALTNTSTELDLDIQYGNETVLRPTKLVYYGFGFPATGIGGSCTGNVVITATSDPSFD